MALTLRTGGGLLSPASAVNQNKGTNNGGLIGGVGYLGEKTALGFLSGVEGIWDYTAGGVAKLFGADKWAERQFVNDWVDYAHADEWYDPGKGWQVAGDVAGGIGTSLPAITGVGIGALTVSLTGGAGLGIGAPIIAGSIAGLGAAGNATKEAYRKSGTLGGKEFAYGALSGATEAGIEALTAGIGTGTGRIISSLSKKAAGDTVKTLTKSGARSVIGHLAADFASEAVEEGLAEALDPIYQRLTVDPNAKNATAGEIAYAALIGGLSGLVMSGGTAAVNTMANLNSGAAAVENGTADAIIKTASQLSAYEDANDTGYDSFRNISAGFKALSESLKSTGGQITTAKQKMLLGSLKQAETAAFIEPFVERSATNLLVNAESAAQRFSQLGMKDGDGNPLSFTAEEIRSGVDADLLARATAGQLSGSERKKFVKQLRAAMATNSALTTLAVADATGRITMDTRRFAEAAREGAEIATTADLNYFAENASADEISALAEDLGIEDWASLTLEDFQAKAAEYAQSERGREMSFQSKRIQEAKAAENTAAQPLPQRFGSGTPEGATHYRSEDGRMDMALIREGDRYHLYDYASGRISGEMTLGKVNALVSDYNAQTASERAERARLAEEERREKLSAVRYNGLASEHIKDWNRLSEPVKQMVRMTMRQAEAAGLSESEAVTFGRVAAHSGVNIVFSSARSAAGDGMLRGDTIYIDPQANKDRIEKRLLVHEMAHALMKGADGWAFMNEVFYQADPEKARKVAEQYIRFYRDQGYSAEQYMPIVNEEIAAAHLEETLGSIDAWDYILKESEPSLKEKVLRFFGKSAQDYAGAEDLSSEARKLLFSYKKMFDQLAERNRGNNAVEMAREDADNKKTVTRMNEENMRVTGERFALPENGLNKNRIALGMSDSERTRILREKSITAPIYEGQADILISENNKKLESQQIGLVKSAIVTIGKEFGILGQQINIKDVGVVITMSKSNLKESVSKDVTPAQMAKLLPILKESVENAIGIEAHDNRYYFDTDTVFFENLLGGYVDGDYFVPVRFGLKHSSTGATTLYVVIDQNKIQTSLLQQNKKTEVITTTASQNVTTSAARSVNYSITDIIPFVNSKDVLRYLPDDMLDEKQKSVKWEEIANTIKKTNGKNDKKYMEYIRNGNVYEAQRMVNEAAKRAGYIVKAYHGTTKKFTAFDKSKIGQNYLGYSVGGFYFTTDKRNADYYSGKWENGNYIENPQNTISAFLNLGNSKETTIDSEYFYNGAEWLDADPYARVEEPLETYDSVVVHHKKGDTIVVKDPEQIKAADTITYDDNDNIIPLSQRFQKNNLDIRYALPEEGSEGKKSSGSDVMPAKNISDIFNGGIIGVPKNPSAEKGRLEKAIANASGETVFSKNKIIEALGKIPEMNELTKTTRDYIAESIWIGVNKRQSETARAGFAKNAARYMTAAVVNESKVKRTLSREDQAKYKKRYSALKKGIEKIGFSTNEMLTMSKKLNSKELQGLLYAWGVKESEASPISSSDFFSQLGQEVPEFAYLSELPLQDAWREVRRLYRDTRKIVKGGEPVQQYAMITRDEFKSMQKYFEESILDMFSSLGQKTKYAKEREELNSLRNYKKTDTIRNQIIKLSGKLRELKIGTFSNATQMETDTFKGLIKDLADIEYRGNLSMTKAKNAIRDVSEWYSSKDVKEKILMYQDDQDAGFFNKGIAEILHDLASVEGDFTEEQYGEIRDIMSYFVNFVEKYGKIYRNDQWVDAKPEAERYVGVLQSNEKLGLGLMERVIRFVKYLFHFGDPAAVVRQMDMYQRGFYTEMYEELRAAAEDADVQLMNVMRDYDAFLKEHPKYMHEAAKQQINWKEEGSTATMPKMVAISLYMTSKREHAQAGLALNGFEFEDAKGNVTRTAGALLRNVDNPKKVKKEEISEAISDLQSRIRKQLSPEDLRYIEILEKAYGTDLRKLKMDRDKQRQGFTNATDGYYYPIRRADVAKSIDVSVFAELDRVSNASFNKNIVEGARGKLLIDDADVLFHRHATAVTRYYSLSPAIENFNVLFNMDISGNPNNSVSVATVGKSQWKEAKEYFRDLIGDIQGKTKSTGTFDKALSKARSGYAMYQLGANPKTVVTQLSSLFASSSILEPTAIMSGLKYGGKDVDQYCKLAELRHYDAAAVKAQGVLDRVGAAGELLMKPIGGMDRLVVRILWGACQVQVSKDQKLKIGTEENKVAAGKLLEQVLFETQQNSLATERSAAMRSGSEFAKAITMFSADGMKVTGRVLDGFGEVSVLKRRIKAAGEAEKEALQEQLKAAMKKARRAVAALIGSAAFSVAIAEAFRWLYNKKREEDENVVLDLTGELVGNMMGGLPLFRDLYDRIVDGYEMDNFTVSMLNDLFGTFDSALDLTGKAFKGEAESTDYTSLAKQTAYVAGQFTGVPVRNIYNLLTGLTRRVSPNAGYQIDRFFYKKNYRNDLKKAIEAGDANRVALLTGIIHGKDATGEIGEENMAELNRLAMAGYSVLPRTVSDKVTVNGEEVELAPEQAEALAEAYDERWSGAVAELMSYSVFANLDDKHKQKAIRKAHDIAYEEALLSLGMDRSERSVVLASAIGIGRAAAYYAAVSGISADVDKKGATIEGSRRRKILEAIDSLEVRREEKLMLITVSGYSLKDGDIRGMTAEREKRLLLSYILKMSGKSASEKAAIAEMCGFEVKDGKIMRSSLVSA